MLPFTIGFMDFDLKLDDILETEKDDIATVSFMPGAEWEYLLKTQLETQAGRTRGSRT